MGVKIGVLALQGDFAEHLTVLAGLGAEGVFVGSGIFKSADPARRAKAIVAATTHFRDPLVIAEVSKGLGEAMPGLEIAAIPQEERLAGRGW